MSDDKIIVAHYELDTIDPKIMVVFVRMATSGVIEYFCRYFIDSPIQVTPEQLLGRTYEEAAELYKKQLNEGEV